MAFLFKAACLKLDMEEGTRTSPSDRGERLSYEGGVARMAGASAR